MTRGQLLNEQGTFKLHPNFANWIDSESLRIFGLVQDLTHRAPAGAALPKEESDLPVKARIWPEDIIGTPIISQSDVAGRLITRFYPQGDKWLGLADEGMVEARRLAERIWDRPEIRDRVSPRTIEELLLEWVGEKSDGGSLGPLSGRIERTSLSPLSPSPWSSQSMSFT
jgi:hypothetical protein